MPSKRTLFVQSLMAWIDTLGLKQTILLSSVASHDRHDRFLVLPSPTIQFASTFNELFSSENENQHRLLKSMGILNMLDPIISKISREDSDEGDYSSHFIPEAQESKDQAVSAASQSDVSVSKAPVARVIGSCITRHLFEAFKLKSSVSSQETPKSVCSNLLCLVMFATDGDNASEGLMMASLVSALFSPAVPAIQSPQLFGCSVTLPQSWSLAFGPPANSDLYV